MTFNLLENCQTGKINKQWKKLVNNLSLIKLFN